MNTNSMMKSSRARWASSVETVSTQVRTRERLEETQVRVRVVSWLRAKTRTRARTRMVYRR
jgi:hypothetical protein